MDQSLGGLSGDPPSDTSSCPAAVSARFGATKAAGGMVAAPRAITSVVAVSPPVGRVAEGLFGPPSAGSRPASPPPRHIGLVNADSQMLLVTRQGPGSITSDPPGVECGQSCSASFPTG